MCNGQWGSCDVLDLDEDSWRSWVVDMLMRHGTTFHPTATIEHSPYRVTDYKRDVMGQEVEYRERQKEESK
jgi:hypothetical protein